MGIVPGHPYASSPEVALVSNKYSFGELYALGRPLALVRFVKVLGAGPTSVWVRPFARPPMFQWDLRPAVPGSSPRRESIGSRVCRAGGTLYSVVGHLARARPGEAQLIDRRSGPDQ